MIYLLLFLFSRFSWANEAVPTFENSPPPTWEEQKSDTLGLQIGPGAPSLALAFHPATSNGKVIYFNPNSPTYTQLGITYGGLGLGVGLNNPVADDDQDLKGKTKMSDFQFRLLKEDSSLEFFFQNYLGYYVENSDEIDATYADGKSYLKRPDLGTEHWGAQYIHVYRPKEFSITANFDQFQRQTSSGGSALSFLFLDHQRVFSSKSFVPDQVQVDFPISKNFDEALLVSGGIGAGYGYTWVKQDYFFSILSGVGLGFLSQRFSGGSDYLKTNRSSVRALIRPSIGYNGPESSLAMQFSADSNIYEIKDNESLTITSVDFKILYGRRISEVNIPPLKWLAKTLD